MWVEAMVQAVRDLAAQIRDIGACVNDEECLGDCTYCESVATYNEIGEMIRAVLQKGAQHDVPRA